MEQRPFGHSDLTVSALGFGAGAIGGLLVRGDAAEQRRATSRAIEAGITYFDTAPSYGDGRSERALGAVLRDLDPGRRLRVGTKVRLSREDLGDIRRAVQRSVEGSIQRLGREPVDVLYLHNPIGRAGSVSAWGVVLADELVLGEVADALQAVAQRGLIRVVGLTGLGEEASLRAVITSRRFEAVQAYFNALNPSAGFPGAAGSGQDFAGLIDRAATAGLAVVAIRVMAAGAVSGDPVRHPNAGGPGAPLARGSEYERDLERARGLADLAQAWGLEGTLELSLRFALSKPGVSTVLVGYSDQRQLEEALRWTSRGPLTPDAVGRIVARAQGS
jgi:L-galactose dehydrogenase/L-glyceraldehyde 3-phosphate reductase